MGDAGETTVKFTASVVSLEDEAAQVLTVTSSNVTVGVPLHADKAFVSGSNVSELIRDIESHPGIDTSFDLDEEHVSNASVDLNKLKTVEVITGGTGATSFPQGQVVLAAGPGVFTSHDGIKWRTGDVTGGVPELVANGGISIGGVSLVPGVDFETA